MADMALIQEAQLWMRHWRCAASGVSCQIRIAGIVHFFACYAHQISANTKQKRSST